MTSPIVAFKAAVQQWLLLDMALLGLLREAKIFADQPKHAAYPHIAFITALARDNGTSSDEGHILELTLAIWSRHRGSEESLTITAAIEQRLGTLPKALNGHRLINLIVRSVEPTRLRDGETWRTDLRIRAVTEVI
jgi:Protein of unknown function (DUF3168)